MSYFKVNILTPGGVVEKNIDATSVTINTVWGEINVLPEHTHIISELAPGTVTVKTPNGDRHFFTTVGIVKILKDRITILCDVSEKAEKIDKERAERAKKLALAKLASKEHLNELDIIKYTRKLERAEQRLKLAYLR